MFVFYRYDVQNEFFEAIKAAGLEIKSQIVRDKVIHGLGDLNGQFAPQHELMIYATKGRHEFTGNRPKTVYRCKRVDAEKLIHPNEKPVNLIQALIRDLTTKDETLLDLFMGSGATAVASIKEKRNYLGSELDKGYCELIEKRIRSEKAQTRLF